VLWLSFQPASAAFDIAVGNPVYREHIASTARACEDRFNHRLPESSRSEHWPDLSQLILPESKSCFARNDPGNTLCTTALCEFAERKLLKLDRPGLTALASDDTLNSRVA
jgi:hypothetical protein